MSSTYLELPPPPALAHLLVCTWMHEIGDAPERQEHRVLPDGCADILLIGEAPPEIVGPASGHVVARLAPRTRILGVRFRPGRLPDALGLPSRELLDQQLPLADVWRPARSVRELEDRAGSGQDVLARLGDQLARRWRERPPHDPLAMRAVTRLTGPRAVSVQTLARESGISERQLRRRVEASTGYAPMTLQRIARFQRLLFLSRTRPMRTLSLLALEAGYADQAHMTREVRALAGTTPARLLRRDDRAFAMSDPFKTEPHRPG